MVYVGKIAQSHYDKMSTFLSTKERGYQVNNDDLARMSGCSIDQFLSQALDMLVADGVLNPIGFGAYRKL